MPTLSTSCEGIALIDKPKGKTSFYLVSFLRKLTSVRCIGHAGTLDPFATGVMVLLVGKPYTRKAQELISFDKEYLATVKFGVATDTYDVDGTPTFISDQQPNLEEIEKVCKNFQGEVLQTPPMFSAKKVNGKKLYDLARKGQVIHRDPKKVTVDLQILNYSYPYLDIRVNCSSGTYIRSIAHDLGQALGCGAHLTELRRTKVGPFSIDSCQTIDQLFDQSQLTLKDSW